MLRPYIISGQSTSFQGILPRPSGRVIDRAIARAPCSPLGRGWGLGLALQSDWGRGAACCAPTSPRLIASRTNRTVSRQIGYAPRDHRPQHARMERPWHPRVTMHRRSIRLRGHDYGGPGVYLVTVCASSHLFGRVRTSELIVSRLGEIARECWTSIPNHFPHVRIDAFVVMPDHIHGILFLGSRHSHTRAIGRIRPGSLGAVVRSFKSAVAARINALRGARVGGVWQRNYFDQIIRNRADLTRVRRYIFDNPARWDRNRTT